MPDSLPLDEDACWARLTAEGGAGEGPDFFYGVTTTGVVCRPGCPSRRARRENVRFFADLATAEAAGFRPCKRCRPDQALGAAAARAKQAVETACALIRDTLEAGEAAPTLGALYEAGFGAVSDAYRAVKQATGTTPARLRAGGFDLWWGIVRTVLGLTLVAATEEGIAALFMGDDEGKLAADLALRFPKARLVRDEGRLAPLLEAVAARAAAPGLAADLP
ncbi:MAG: Ada metal-binding domain-containing protein, partial [Zavarzinia sp.]|nr:Ada metal-binding domain-containing protein [Zavarzinia sp.]